MISVIAASAAIFASALFSAAHAAMIAIDVGHYFEEPGVISARGRPEFEFNLVLARAIEAALNSRGHAVQLVGADGAMKELWRRPRAARGTDLFLSVHHDSMQQRFLTTWTYEGVERLYGDRFAGFSLFISRENPAWRTALRCASAIGGELRKGGFKPSLYHADPIYGEGRAFADAQNGVHYFDHLAVLRRASMPAVLFEAGVIVNREEENRLSDSKVQNDIAARVVDGIESCVN